MYRYPFAVGDEVFCCWEHDLPERNERFLKTLDAAYFSHAVEHNVEQLEGSGKQRAAVALRVAYRPWIGNALLATRRIGPGPGRRARVVTEVLYSSAS
jgi:hypothetical protein